MVVNMLRPLLMPWAGRQIAILPHLGLAILANLKISTFNNKFILKYEKIKIGEKPYKRKQYRYDHPEILLI